MREDVLSEVDEGNSPIECLPKNIAREEPGQFLFPEKGRA